MVDHAPTPPLRVVIVGGGFGGLQAARAFAGRDDVSVIVVDRRNHHVFQPLLYQVATAALSPGDIASPIRWVLRRQKNVTVLLGNVVRIDPDAKCLQLEAGAPLPYDALVLAAGATHAYFGHDEWQEAAPGLKTLEDALRIRQRVLLAFERAERAATGVVDEDPAQLTFVVVGGGPTGVELAGALAEIARHTLANDFRRIDPARASIVLVEAGPRLLASFPDAHGQFAYDALTRLGVHVRLQTSVTDVDAGGVTVKTPDDETARIAARTVLWAAGVAASPLGRAFAPHLDRAGRVRVTPELSVPDRPEVFVIGDLASLDGDNGQPLPGVAQVAMQQGTHAASNILRARDGQSRRPFSYRDLGNMATIGRAKAVADLGYLQLRGFVAWLAWLFVHLMSLIGFRNRLSVLLQWAWAYLSFQRSVRLITEDES